MSNVCSICLDGCRGNRRKVFVTECKHSFHLSCIRKVHDKRCPCCKVLIKVPLSRIRICNPITESPVPEMSVAETSVQVAAQPSVHVAAPYERKYRGEGIWKNKVAKVAMTLYCAVMINLCTLSYFFIPRDPTMFIYVSFCFSVVTVIYIILFPFSM